MEWPKGAQCPEKIMMKSKEETLPAVPLDMKGTLRRVLPPLSQLPGYHLQVLYRDQEKQGQPTFVSLVTGLLSVSAEPVSGEALH